MWLVADLDEDYIAKMEDVLATYEQQYDPEESVLCLDEKPVTLHADVRPTSPAQPGREARRDNEYESCGTANVFCAVEPKAGRHFTFPTPDRSGFEFAQVAVALALAYPAVKTIHLVVDNLNIHSQKSLTEGFGAEMAAEVWDRFTVHYTPSMTVGSIKAEIEIGIFSRQCLGKRLIPNLESVSREATAWNRMNRDHVTINWKFDRKIVRRKFGYKRKSFTRSETLGLFQHDVNVVWDLAPHDLSIKDHLIPAKPDVVLATGQRHLNGYEDVAYLTVFFDNSVIAHVNVHWLSPVKERTTLLGGEKKMLVWNDLEADEKVKVHDNSVKITSGEGIFNLLVSYSSGDMWAPKIERLEALNLEVKLFY